MHICNLQSLQDLHDLHNVTYRLSRKPIFEANLFKVTYFGFLFFRIQKREKYSRRRAHLDEEDIDYINERNMKFNQKLARFYDPFTAEIKQNLERGTAI